MQFQVGWNPLHLVATSCNILQHLAIQGNPQSISSIYALDPAMNWRCQESSQVILGSWRWRSCQHVWHKWASSESSTQLLGATPWSADHADPHDKAHPGIFSEEHVRNWKSTTQKDRKVTSYHILSIRNLGKSIRFLGAANPSKMFESLWNYWPIAEENVRKYVEELLDAMSAAAGVEERERTLQAAVAKLIWERMAHHQKSWFYHVLPLNIGS